MESLSPLPYKLVYPHIRRRPDLGPFLLLLELAGKGELSVAS